MNKPKAGKSIHKNLSASKLNEAFHFAARAKAGAYDQPTQMLPIGARASDICFCQNGSGADVGMYGVLAIDAPLFTPSDSLKQFKQRVQLRGRAHTAGDQQNFVVALEPIKAGKVGRVQMRGIVQAEVDIKDLDHTHCELKAGTSVLESSATGVIPIVWQAGTSTEKQWCYVSLNAMPEMSWVFKAITTITAGDYSGEGDCCPVPGGGVAEIWKQTACGSGSAGQAMVSHDVTEAVSSLLTQAIPAGDLFHGVRDFAGTTWAVARYGSANCGGSRSESSVSDSSVSDPSFSDPSDSDPSVSDPSVSDPSTSDPSGPSFSVSSSGPSDSNPSDSDDPSESDPSTSQPPEGCTQVVTGVTFNTETCTLEVTYGNVASCNGGSA
ncbi:MAG: hypothetical protein COA78_24725 [Blastopirellula sp.]|nr:MAG: hypothetical protein COA78_24725 [Blastopirellula sp.]